jgi:hypothetical protein
MLTRQIGLAGAIMGANLRSPDLPYKVTFVATYHCNFRCEMCNIWQKKSVDEMTPEEVALFFEKYPQFKWVHLTGGELFMRRDLDELVAAIQKSCRSLYLLNFPTTGWFGDKTVKLVERTLARGVGRLMTTISIDGPRELHEEMRGLKGSWDKGIETFRRLRGIKRSNFPDGGRHDADGQERQPRRRDARAIREVIPISAIGAAPERRATSRATTSTTSAIRSSSITSISCARSRTIDEERVRAPSCQVPGGSVSALVSRYYETASRRSVHGAFVVLLHRRLLEPVRLLDLGCEGREPAR